MFVFLINLGAFDPSSDHPAYWCTPLGRTYMMTHTRIPSIRLAAVLAVVATIVLGTTASAQTTLSWKFQRGQVFEQTMTQSTKSSIAVGTQNFDNTVNQVIASMWTVNNVDSQGIADVTQEIKRIQLKISGVMNLEIDSASPQAPQGAAATLAPAITAMAKAKFQMKMTPQGEILEVEVSQDTLDGLKALPSAGQLGNLLSKDTLVDMIKKGAPAMPKEAVKNGSTWSSTLEVTMGPLGKMGSLTKLTYAGPETVDGKPLERINMEVTTTIEKPAAEKAPTPMTPDISITDQKAQGALYFDNVAGRIDHSELQQDMTMLVGMANQKFNQKVQTTTKTVLVPAATPREVTLRSAADCRIFTYSRCPVQPLLSRWLGAISRNTVTAMTRFKKLQCCRGSGKRVSELFGAKHALGRSGT